MIHPQNCDTCRDCNCTYNPSFDWDAHNVYKELEEQLEDMNVRGIMRSKGCASYK